MNNYKMDFENTANKLSQLNELVQENFADTEDNNHRLSIVSEILDQALDSIDSLLCLFIVERNGDIPVDLSDFSDLLIEFTDVSIKIKNKSKEIEENIIENYR